MYIRRKYVLNNINDKNILRFNLTLDKSIKIVKIILLFLSKFLK